LKIGGDPALRRGVSSEGTDIPLADSHIARHEWNRHIVFVIRKGSVASFAGRALANYFPRELDYFPK